MTLKVADLFCGAGGFSTGMLKALGADVELVAVNHWQRAIDTHSKNHPTAKHLRVDVYETAPLEAVPGGELDLLMASPTCTFYSRARGGRPVSWDQRKGRMTPTQVYRWCRDLKVKRLLVENVPEFREWGPVCKRNTSCKRHAWKGPEAKGDICGARIKEKSGIYFKRWVARLRSLGFRCEWRVINSADHGDATTRERFFLMGRSDGGPINWPAPSHSKDGTPDLFGAGAKKWRAAREIILWSRRGRSIFGRKKALAPKTLLRIHAGLVKFNWPARFALKLRLYMLSLGIALPAIEWTGDAARPFVFQMNQSRERMRGIRSVEAPLGTVLASGTDLGLVEPLLMRTDQHKSHALCVWDGKAPVPTLTTRGGVGVLEPFLLPQHFGNPARSVDLPAPPPVAVDRTALVEPFVLNRHGDNNGGTGSQRGRSIDEPLSTPTASGAGYVVEPFLFGNRTNNVPKGVDSSPMPTNTTTTGGGIGLVEPGAEAEPFVLSQGAGGSPRGVSDPVPAIPTKGATSFIAPYYGTGSPSSVEAPLGTATTRDRFGIVMPVTHHDSSNRARSTDEPLPTVTSAPRGELAFLTAAFGERETQAPRVRSVEEPTPSICAKGRVPLVQGEALAMGWEPVEAIRWEDLTDVDILFRMLEPDELAAAMGFPKRYKFRGNKTERTRQIGNAVAVNTARALVAALMEMAA